VRGTSSARRPTKERGKRPAAGGSSGAG
jgi:hypothetical protein